MGLFYGFAQAEFKRTDISDGILIILVYHYINDVIPLDAY